MLHRRIKITIKPIFLLLWSILLISRILVLTNNYDWPVNPVLLEGIYLVGTSILVLIWDRGKVKLRRGNHILVLGLVLLHTVLWGVIFNDQSFLGEIRSHFRSQIMFVAIMWVTVFALQQLDATNSFIKCSYYTMSVVLICFFLTHLSEFDLGGLRNVLSLTGRTRANFGFGHYNTVGAVCACGIIIREIVKKDCYTFAAKAVNFAILVILSCMMLNSASRAAITSVIIYLFAYYSPQKDKLPVSKRAARIIDVLSKALLGVLILWSVIEVDFKSLLQFSQRSHLAELVLPMFFETGELWFGLGYASNTAYAEGLTPYVTHWMDNAYVYYLVTTGILGLAILMVATILMGYDIYKRKNLKLGREAFSAFLVYIYISLFEATLYSSGGIVNYIYLPWFLTAMLKNKNVESPQR